jgi:hypothetical protein
MGVAYAEAAEERPAIQDMNNKIQDGSPGTP